jgi:hypothetical protein
MVAPQGKRKLEQFLAVLMDEQGGARLSRRGPRSCAPTGNRMRFDSRRSLDRRHVQLAGVSLLRHVGNRLFLSSVVWMRAVARDARIENALHACD